jgi:hypothetical protein
MLAAFPMNAGGFCRFGPGSATGLVLTVPEVCAASNSLAFCLYSWNFCAFSRASAAAFCSYGVLAILVAKVAARTALSASPICSCNCTARSLY